MVQAFQNLKTHLPNTSKPHTSSKKATPLNPFQEVPPIWNQVFQHEPKGVTLIQTTTVCLWEIFIVDD